MGSRFVHPVQQQLNASGDALPGSKLSFFDANTTTPRAVFTDANLTTPHSQPVVSDAAGVFPEIFLDGNSYRATFSDADDVVIDTWEPISGIVLTNTPLLFTRIVERFTATQDQTLFTLANSYTVGADELQIYTNGVFQTTPDNYTESSTTTITFTEGLDAGDFVLVSNLKNSDISVQIEIQSATAGQTLFTISTFTYDIGSNKLLTYVNGILQSTPENYSETSTSSITFSAGLDAGDRVVLYRY